MAITSEFTISQSALATGQLINGVVERPFSKVNVFHSDNADGIIILAAFRRRSGTNRRKFKKVMEVTTEKAMKVTSEETVKPSTTEKVVEVTTEQAVKVTPDQEKSILKVRRNEGAYENSRNGLWIARKRVTRPPKSVPTRKKVKVNVVVDEEDYSIRRARYLFSQRSGKR